MTDIAVFVRRVEDIGGVVVVDLSDGGIAI